MNPIPLVPGPERLTKGLKPKPNASVQSPDHKNQEALSPLKPQSSPIRSPTSSQPKPLNPKALEARNREVLTSLEQHRPPPCTEPSAVIGSTLRVWLAGISKVSGLICMSNVLPSPDEKGPESGWNIWVCYNLHPSIHPSIHACMHACMHAQTTHTHTPSVRICRCLAFEALASQWLSATGACTRCGIKGSSVRPYCVSSSISAQLCLSSPVSKDLHDSGYQ